MTARSLWFGMFGFPPLCLLALAAFMTPRYVPSARMAEAIASSADPAVERQRIAESFVRRCGSDWNMAPARLDGVHRLYSWENDAGLLARTTLVCAPGGPCTVEAAALVALPSLTNGDGKAVPTGLWGCRRRGL